MMNEEINKDDGDLTAFTGEAFSWGNIDGETGEPDAK